MNDDGLADRGFKPDAAAEPTGHDAGDPFAHSREPTAAHPQSQAISSAAFGGRIGSQVDADPRAASAVRCLRSISGYLELPPDPTSVRRARRWTAHLLESWGLTEIVDSATLVISELATNAITVATARAATTGGPRPHGIALHLHYDGETLLVEVHDPCTGTVPEVRHSPPGNEGGRGLQVVAALCKQWGFRETAHGKVVWCELSGEQ